MSLRKLLLASSRPDRSRSLAPWRNERGELWLNVASSHVTLPGFVNVDNGVFFRLAHVYPALAHAPGLPHRETLELYWNGITDRTTLFADCRRRLPFPDGSVDHILCSHFLEHVYPDEADTILAGFFSVLKPGGTLHVIVPDLKEAVDRYTREYGSERAAGGLVEETLLSLPLAPGRVFRLLEATGGFGLQHRWMYDLPALEAKVKARGFQLVSGQGSPSADFPRDGIHVCAKRP
ncbi:MAG: methyltransferase domain-containing protein [Myxococcales bacterium]|nr:methyltransferase domain-containing protein [Myxococcales bacterium]